MMVNGRASKKIAIIGGSGSLGSGLAIRWARAGHDIAIGSRDGAEAAKSAVELTAKAGVSIAGRENTEAAAAGEVIALTVRRPSRRSRTCYRL